MRHPSQFRNRYMERRYNQQPQQFYPPFQANFPVHTQQHPLKGMASGGLQGLSRTLDYVQRFANMMETAAPMIEKYKPVVKNLPMMYQMLKAMQNEKGITDDHDKGDNDHLKQKGKHQQHKAEKERPDHTSKREGISTPKLFIK